MLGDRLSIGPIELEILAPQGPADPPAMDSAPAALDTEWKRLEADQAALERDRQQWESRLAEMRARHLALEQERHRWEVQRAAAETDLSHRAKQLEARQAEIENQENTLQEERRRWNTEQAQTEHRLEAWATRLELRQAELEAAEAAARQESERASLHATQQPSPVTQPATSSEPTTELRFEQVQSRSPLSSAEVFRKVGITPSLPEEEEENRSPASPAPTDRGGPRTCPEPGDEAKEEESIDQYMARLLARVRNDVSDADGPASGRDSRSRPPERPAPSPQPDAPDPPSPPDATRCAVPKRREPVEMSPRAVAAEKSVDLTVLREVANLSAQHAIGRHSRRKSIRAIGGKLVVALFGLAAAVYLLGRWWFGEAGAWLLYAGCLAFVIALVWLHYVLLAGRTIAAGPGRQCREPGWSPSPTADPAAPRSTAATLSDQERSAPDEDAPESE